MPIHALHAAEVPKGQRPYLVALALALITFFVQRIVLLLGATGGNLDFDQDVFHIPVIRRFTSEWPLFDLADYAVATTPGFHIVIATLAKVFGVEILNQPIIFLRILSGAFCVGLVGYVALHCVRRTGHAIGIALAMLLLFNPYIVIVGTRVAPESISWLFVAMALGFAIGPRTWTRMLITGSIITIGAVATRQNNLWLAALVWATAWMGSSGLTSHKSDANPIDLFPGRGILPGPTEFHLRERTARLLPALLATLPSFLLVIYFVALWGGLVPPQFQDDTDQAIDGTSKHIGGNPAVPAVILALFGMYTPFLLPLITREIRDVLRRARPGRWLIWTGATLGLVAALAVETTYSHAEGRWGSYWSIVRNLPTPGGRSIVIVPLASLGGAAIGAILAASQPRTRWILLVALLGFIAANTANSKAWIRYYDPFVVIWGIFAVADVYLVRRERPALKDIWKPLLAPLALAVAFAALSLHRLFG